MVKRFVWVPVCLLIAAGLAFANGQTEKAAGASKVTGTFYELYQSCPSNPFWVAVNNGAKAAAATLGVKLKIEDPLKCTGEIPQEANLLTTIINSHPAGIAMSVVSSTAFSSEIQRARSLHIPIVAYNSLPTHNDFAKNPVEAYVGQNNYEAGVALAKRTISTFNLQSGDTVIAADQCYINRTCYERYLGINKVLKPMGVHVVLMNLDYDIAKSTGILKAYFENHGKPAAIYAFGSASVEEAVNAMKELGYSKGQPPIGSFDDDPIANKYMLEGWNQITVDQQPFLQGYDALVDLYSAVKYKEHPINMATGPEFVMNTAADRGKGWLTTSVVKATGL